MYIYNNNKEEEVTNFTLGESNVGYVRRGAEEGGRYGYTSLIQHSEG